MESLGSLTSKIIADLERKVEAHKDRADMRADSALDETRPVSERRRDYLRYEDEAEAAQREARKLAALENLKRERERFPSLNPLDDVPESRRAWW